MPPERVRQWDREHRFPTRAVPRSSPRSACAGSPIDEEYGGQGRDLVAAVAVIEELCRGGAFAAGPFIHCAFYGGINISENGSEAQKRELLPKLARGELLFAYGLSEPDVGGDLASVRTTARRSDGRPRAWCCAAASAGAPARTSPTTSTAWCAAATRRRATRTSRFVLVPPRAPGVTIQPIEHVNLRYTLSSRRDLRGRARCRSRTWSAAPAGWNRGWRMLAGRALDVEKLEITAVTFGIAQAAVEEAWRYAQERVQFGKPISGHQAVRHALVEARTRLEACRHMLYHAAWLAQQERPCSVETSMAKLFVADTAVEIVLACQRVLGAYGLAEGYDMERHVRDVLGMPIVGGSSNMQKNNIANRLGLRG